MAEYSLPSSFYPVYLMKVVHYTESEISIIPTLVGVGILVQMLIKMLKFPIKSNNFNFFGSFIYRLCILF